VTVPFVYQTESGESAPTQLFEVDDGVSADQALARVRRGETLWHRGTFLNAKQLISAMSRRLTRPPVTTTALDAFRQERRTRQLEHETVSKLLVGLDRQYRVQLTGAPDARSACEHVWGASTADLTVTPLKTLLGMLGAQEWRKKGLAVPGLKGTLIPSFGVYTPTRAEYVDLVARVRNVDGRTVFDVGTGTGVLAFLLLQRGATHVVATDIEPRAVRCAKENAVRLRLESRFSVMERPLFPEGQADLIVCNPPWIPEAPKNRFDRAVFDLDNAFLLGFLEGLSAHLTVGGRGLLIISDLAERLGLRQPGWLESSIAAAGLVISERFSAAARHGKSKDTTDPLHAARSKELTTLYTLTSSR
jgi:methylase of polypeptide subunit release factors